MVLSGRYYNSWNFLSATPRDAWLRLSWSMLALIQDGKLAYDISAAIEPTLQKINCAARPAFSRALVTKGRLLARRAPQKKKPPHRGGERRARGRRGVIFAKGASLEEPSRLFNSRRAIDFH